MKFEMSRLLRSSALAVTVAIAGLAVPAWAQESITVIAPSDAQPNNILPGRAGNYPWINNVFEAVFDLDPETFAPVPVLATDWSVAEDGLSMSITLRDDVTFHTGRRMTADDIRFTIETARDPSTASQVGFIADEIESIDIKSDTELELKFARPLSNIYEFFARTPVIDQETYADRADGSQVIGTGPYRFAEWNPGSGSILERYDGYRDPEAAKIAEIEVAVISDPTAMISALRSNRAQIAWGMQPRDVIEFLNNPMYTVTPAGGSQYPLGLDVNTPPFDNKLVRQAIGYAIDRERIGQQVFDGLAVPTALFWTPGSPGYDDTVGNTYAYDPDKARQLLAEAGAEGTTITIALHALPSQRAIFEIVQNNLKDVGFNVEANILDTATFGERQVAGDLGPAFLQLHGMVGLSAQTLIGSAPAIREGNPSHFWPEEYVKLRTDLQQAVGDENVAAAVEALSAYMIDEAFNLVLVQASSQSVVNTQVTGVTFSSTGAVVLKDAEYN